MKRRSALVQCGAIVLSLGLPELARGATILNVRIWPAPDYSRVTIESDGALQAHQLLVGHPPRLAVDIDGITLNAALRELVAKVNPNDPNIAGIRVGQFTPTTVRLVLDLKKPMRPQVFTLAPVANYRNRLVFDLYPEQEADPMDALIAQRAPTAPNAPNAPNAPATASSPTANSASSANAVSAANAASDPLSDLIAQRTGTPVATASSTRTNHAAPTTSASAASSASDTEALRAVNGTDRLIIVALDPGHGGEDPGAIGPGGTREKDVVLRLAHLLRDRINDTTVRGTTMRAYLTRDADFFVPLGVRVQKARRVQADLFVSLHADAFFTPDPQGASVFALSQGGASSSAARWMAARENKADLIGGLNVKAHDATVQRAMLDMSTTAQINDSLKLGSTLLGEIRRIGKLHKGRVEQAAFAVLKAPDIPSVLVEAAFISNPSEEAKLNSEAYQNQLADALLRGITQYFARNPPLARNRSVS